MAVVAEGLDVVEVVGELGVLCHVEYVVDFGGRVPADAGVVVSGECLLAECSPLACAGVCALMPGHGFSAGVGMVSKGDQVARWGV